MVYSTEQKAFMVENYFRNGRKLQCKIVCKNFSFSFYKLLIILYYIITAVFMSYCEIVSADWK
jgi:hypothetical protein